MSALSAKLRPHLLSWHMLPCLVMLVAAVVVPLPPANPAECSARWVAW